MGGTVRIYKSSDASAPTLSGTAGALLTVLDAILVNGYGSMAAAGWSKPYANSGNQGCYRMATTGNSGHYLNILDSGPGGAGAAEAQACGFVTMSALGTGTGQFPTVSQLAIGIGNVVIRKSATADATASNWWCIADDSCFYFVVETGDFLSPSWCTVFFFGDIFSLKSGDAYKSMIIGRQAENNGTANYEPFGAGVRGNSSSAMSELIAGHYMSGSWTQVGGSVQVGKIWDYTKPGIGGVNNFVTGASVSQPQTGSAILYAGGYSGQYAGMGTVDFANAPGLVNPNGPDGSILLSPVCVFHGGSLRGYMKGLWVPLAHKAFSLGDTFSGAGNLAGKSFWAATIETGCNNGTIDGGCAVFETSTTWS